MLGRAPLQQVLERRFLGLTLTRQFQKLCLFPGSFFRDFLERPGRCFQFGFAGREFGEPLISAFFPGAKDGKFFLNPLFFGLQVPDGFFQFCFLGGKFGGGFFGPGIFFIQMLARGLEFRVERSIPCLRDFSRALASLRACCFWASEVSRAACSSLTPCMAGSGRFGSGEARGAGVGELSTLPLSAGLGARFWGLAERFRAGGGETTFSIMVSAEITPWRGSCASAGEGGGADGLTAVGGGEGAEAEAGGGE
ncbi:hypothetical protein, partial [Verrucomicrobium spinosum]|uniref:hypothetical protein n=1 Tax=Verrucomicrobium spinosum TaxID=2736 RepID=UPI0009461775